MLPSVHEIPEFIKFINTINDERGHEEKFRSKKCDMKSVTHGFGIKRYGGHTIRERLLLLLFIMILRIFYEFRNFMNTFSFVTRRTTTIT